MAFIRVHELAKKYGLTNEQMIEYLIRNGIEVKTHMSTVDSEKNKKIIGNLETRTNLNEHINNTSIKMINIYGLFGEFDYKFDFVNDIFIWVSENGVGKTTILNLMVALLKGDKKTLMDINFKRIEVKIGNKEFIIDKSKMNKKAMNDRRVAELFEDLRRFLPMSQYTKFRNKYNRTGQLDYEELEDAMHRFVYREFEGFRYEKRLFYLLDEVKELQFNDFTDELYKIKNAVNEEILFYPTYRRIEISLDKVFLDNSRHNTGEIIQYIGFGMDDVKQRIDELLVKMGKDANNSYVEMNSEILNELSKGLDIETLTENVPLINRHKVEVVIKRIGEERLENKDGLLAFVDGDLENPNEMFFKYYVSKLVKIYDSQKAIDDKLSKFAAICTKYLSGKKVVYDEALLSMTVFNKYNKEIKWEDLSSGEKQIVSIFSKVYLDIATMSIFIIDEPEISLSIEWQKEFLKDIYNSGKVGLLIATTHSPFIFKNEFREFTSEINLYRGEY